MAASLIFLKKPASVLSHPPTLLPISSNGFRKTNLNFPIRQCCPAIRVHRQLRHSYITRAAMGDGQENEEKEEEKPIILFKTKIEAVSDKKYMIHMVTLMLYFMLLQGFIIVTYFCLYFRMFRLSPVLIRQRATNLAIRTIPFRSIFSFLTPPLVPLTPQKPNNPWSAPNLGSIMSIIAVTLAPLYNTMSDLTTVTDDIDTIFKYYKYKKSVIFWAGGCIFIQLFASVATLILLAKIWSKVCNIEDPNEQQGNGGGIQTKE